MLGRALKRYQQISALTIGKISQIMECVKSLIGLCYKFKNHDFLCPMVSNLVSWLWSQDKSRQRQDKSKRMECIEKVSQRIECIKSLFLYAFFSLSDGGESRVLTLKSRHFNLKTYLSRSNIFLTKRPGEQE